MVDVPTVVAGTDAPPDTDWEPLDARDLPPPRPLRDTLERLRDLDGETGLVQVNDRAPRHLYPRLTDRGYEYETVETDGAVVTVIWRA
jgi:hypothetical protein